MVEIYTSPSCSSCRKAKKWLDTQKIEYTERNIVDANPTCGELKEWYTGETPAADRW